MITNTNVHRKNHRINNQNAGRLIEKYNNLAREALSNGDKILSESYFQHSDHFVRVQNEKDKSMNSSNLEKTKTIEEKSQEIKVDPDKEKIIASS